MTPNDDFERRIADFYASEPPARAPDWVLESALATVDTTSQRRVFLRAPWRFPNMNMYAKAAAAAVAVIAIGAIGFSVLSPGPGPGTGGDPSPSPSLSPSPGPSQSPSLPSLTESFTSTIHGISISYPAGWVARAATEPWTTSLPLQGPAADLIHEPSNDNIFLSLSSQPLAGRSGEEWAAEISGTPEWSDSCNPPSEPLTVDGNAGVLYFHCDGTPSALTWTSDRGYLIVLYGVEDSTTWFRQITDTARLQPGDAVDAAPSASP
jgi:hypothetical protein